MNVNSAFFERSREVAGRFLQTAVIIEDQPRRFDGRTQPLVEPGRAAGMKVGEQVEPVPDAANPPTNDLDAKLLIDAFAELGIICALLTPEMKSVSFEEDPLSDVFAALSDRTRLATKRADIVILDWNIAPETHRGENAKRLIREILRAD